MNNVNSCRYISLIIIVCSLIFANACSVHSPIAPTQIGPSPTYQPNMVNGGSASYVTARSMKELVDKSTIIVSGQASTKKEIFNMARDVNDITKTDPHVLGVGQVYQFEVNQYIKGNGPNMIYVVQPEGFLYGDQVGLNLSNENIEKARSQEKYIPIQLMHQYILFLHPLGGFPNLKNYYTGGIQPWRFDNSTDMVFPESPWEWALQTFPATRTSVFLDQIEHPDNATSGYPSPPTPYP